METKGKVFVVTGGGNGIGRQLVLALLRSGSSVAAVDISEKALQETKNLAGSLSGNLTTHVVNITDQKSVEALPAEVISVHGKVDGLINNAGIIQPFVRVADLTYPQIEKVMNVNFYGMLFMTKTFLPHFQKRPEAHIVNVSSMGGYLPVPGQTVYGASKAAVKLFTEGLYLELLDSNIHVTVVFPGAISTDISINSGVTTREQAASMDTGSFKMTSPEKVAEIVLDSIHRNKFHVFAGSDAKLTDFLYRLNPKNAGHMIYKQMKSLLK